VEPVRNVTLASVTVGSDVDGSEVYVRVPLTNTQTTPNANTIYRVEIQMSTDDPGGLLGGFGKGSANVQGCVVSTE
jgi:hypothetical protein